MNNQIQSYLRLKSNKLKNNPTRAEKILYQALKTAGIKFVFQSIHYKRGVPRIFDFYIRKQHLVIEVDGLIHEPERDKARDLALANSLPYLRVLRFTNDQVTNETSNVIKTVQSNFI